MGVIIIANQYGYEIMEEVYDFDKNTDINVILGFAIDGWAFRIPHEEDRKLWNKIIDKDWTGLDDCDYYRYNKPYAHDDKWITEEDGYFMDLQTRLNGAKDIIKFLTKVKNLHGGEY